MGEPVRAVVYARLSRDRNEETPGLGIQRQVKLCKELAAARGWTIVKIFQDNDVSATNTKKIRPQYQQMLEDLEAGQFDVIVALDSDRLLRRPIELEHLLWLCENHSVRVVHQAGGFDTETNEGVFEARIRATVDAEEVAKLKRRVRRKQHELARAGRPHGGTRGFGFNSDMTVNKVEAELIRRAATRVLEGVSARSLAREWEEAGVTTPRGGPWRPQTLRRMLMSPRLCGLRQYQGEVIGNAEWDRILEPEIFEAVRAKLSAPSRVTNGRANVRKHHLAGLCFCSKCGARLFTVKTNGAPGLACKKDQEPGACGRLSIKLASLDEYVTNEVLTRLMSLPSFGRALTDTREGSKERKDLVARIEGYRARLEEAEELWKEGKLSTAKWTDLKLDLEHRSWDVWAQLVEETKVPDMRGLPVGIEEIQTRWDSEGADWKRAVLDVVVNKIVIHPAEHRGMRFKKDRVSIKWINPESPRAFALGSSMTSRHEETPSSRRTRGLAMVTDEVVQPRVARMTTSVPTDPKITTAKLTR